MKTCLNCGKSVPVKLVVNGKLRNLNNRKYCLDCSPFGANNRRKLHLGDLPLEGKTCICKICGKGYIYQKTSDMTAAKCVACKTKERRARIKDRAIEYLGGKCNRCGYKRCRSALCFHHRNPSEKEFGISMVYRTWEVTIKELDKCDLLCLNCHAELHELMQTEAVDRLGP